MQVKAILTKPLDGDPEGAEREFDQPDFDRLKAMGAVRAASDEVQDRQDGPTVGDVAPAGQVEPVKADFRREEAEADAEVKKARVPQNKKAPSVLNKSAGE